MLSPAEFNQISRIYQALIAQDISNSSASARCQIYIGTITGILNGCTINLINQCTNNNSYEMLRSAISIVEDLTNNRSIMGIFTQSASGCITQAELEQNITISSFDVGICNAPQGQSLEFNFINSGSARANCQMSNLLVSSFPSMSSTDALANIKRPIKKTWTPPYIYLYMIGFLGAVGLACSIKDFGDSKLETLILLNKS
jgi:hypothetical protein